MSARSEVDTIHRRESRKIDATVPSLFYTVFDFRNAKRSKTGNREEQDEAFYSPSWLRTPT